ncbi:hypothetical protein MASR1M68_11820 [Elusimicrobiota bacterium]
MKKLICIWLLALALFVPAMASAQIKWNGQIDVLGYSLWMMPDLPTAEQAILIPDLF